MLKALLRAPTGMASLVGVVVIALLALVAPPFFLQRATDLNFAVAGLGPSAAHLLGTDELGRDIFARIVVATRLSLLLSIIATGIGAGLGIPIGAIAALLPQRVRAAALRAIDALIVFPGILIAIVIGAILGRGALGATLGVGIAGSFAFARVASTLTLGVSGRDYVSAARVLSLSPLRILVRYVLNNIADTLAITATVAVSSSIIAVSALSFLGLGVQPPAYDWGGLLTEGVKEFYLNPAAAIGPVVAITLVSLTFGLFGEALARAFNPVLWARAGGAVGEAAPVIAASPPMTGRPGTEPARGAGPAAPVLEVEGLTVRFPGRGSMTAIVKDVSFTLAKGDVVGIVGESGSGKTMTAMALSHLVPHPGKVEGAVRLQGTDIYRLALRDVDHELGTRVAMIFQDPLSSLNPSVRIGVQLTEGAEAHAGLSRAVATDLAVDKLREVNLPNRRLLHQYPHEISGGMRQRVMIAMALMSDPVLLIADEPTTALDVTTQAQIIELLARINREHGTAIILITHNLALVSQLCNRVLVMYAGRIVEELTTEQLAERPLHPYTVALRAAIPDLTRPITDPLATIPGQAPSPEETPGGCPYHPRCPLAVERCRTELPPLLARESGRRRVACWVANQDL
jgi:peptide/nickel transport system permease protein